MKISGKKLMAAREAAGVTRTELAAVAGLTHARVWQYETEEVSNVNINVLNAIARKIGVKAKDLVPED